MRKRAGLLTLILSLFVLTGFMILSVGRGRFNDFVVDESTYNEIVSSRVYMEEIKPEIKFNGNPLIYSPQTDTFFYSLKEGSSTADNPLVSVRSGLNFLKIAILNASVSEEMIRSGEEIRFIVYNRHEYKEFSLSLTTLPILYIETWAEISDDDQKMNMTLYDNRKEAASKVIKSTGSVRFRGAMSRRLPKKGLKLSLSQYSTGNNKRPNPISLLGMRKDDDWVLVANYNDQEKVRSTFSQNLWKESCGKDNDRGIDLGSESRFVEVFVNGDYYGLYSLGTPVDEKTFQYSGDVTREALYKGVWWSDLSTLFMVDNGVYGFEVKSGPDSYKDDRIDSSNWDLLLEYCYYLERNRNVPENLKKGIDLNAAIDFYLYTNLIQGQDCTYGAKGRNYYLGIEKTDEGIMKGTYSAWDMDVSWGNKWSGIESMNNIAAYGITPDENYLFEQGYLDQLFINYDSEVLEKMYARYKELRKGAWSEEAILSMIEDYDNQLYGSGAYIREMKRWPDGSYQDPELRLTKFSEYVKERLTECDLYMERYYEKYYEPVLVRRSSKYKGFEDSDILIVFNKPEMKTDKDFIDLFNYLGINPEDVNNNIHGMFYNGKTGSYDFCNDFYGSGLSIDTAIGKVEIKRVLGDEEYFTTLDGGVFVNDVYCYDTVSEYEPDVRFYVINDGRAMEFDYSKDREFALTVVTFNDFLMYVKALYLLDYDVTLTYRKDDIFEDERVKAAIERISDKITLVKNEESKNLVLEIRDSSTGKLIEKVKFKYKMENFGSSKHFVTMKAEHIYQ